MVDEKEAKVLSSARVSAPTAEEVLGGREGGREGGRGEGGNKGGRRRIVTVLPRSPYSGQDKMLLLRKSTPIMADISYDIIAKMTYYTPVSFPGYTCNKNTTALPELMVCFVYEVVRPTVSGCRALRGISLS